MAQTKTHYESNRSYGYFGFLAYMPICRTSVFGEIFETTKDPQKVTCKRCWRHLNVKLKVAKWR